ncbi:MAG TPA: polysaccharide deacetylase family protein [Candidatus Paceibacterota bacterium]|nr:polysaccharide deacetylase family protein [Candidatus Paceibacterota bacterium]
MRFLPASGAIILMYHSIGDNKEFFTVPTDEFERQMEYLKSNGYNVVSLNEVVKALEQKKPISSRTVALTFDDGYRDNYIEAFPILKKYGFPASIFLVSDWIGTTVTVRTGKPIPILEPADLKVMIASGLIEFFPHTVHHMKLTQADNATAEAEIKESAERLAALDVLKDRIFAYPFGLYNSTVVSILRRLNIRAALTVQPGRVRSGADLLTLPRNSIDSRVSFNQFKGIVHRGRISL